MIELKNGRLKVGITKVVNMGNYESEHISLGMETDVPDKTNMEDFLLNSYEEIDKLAEGIKSYLKGN